MSTKSSIKYHNGLNGEPSWHLYAEAFEKEDVVYLELEGVQADVVMIDSVWAKAGTVLLRLPNATARQLGLVPLVKLTDGQRTITVEVSGLAQFRERCVRAMHGEHVGEVLTFTTEAQARQALGTDLSAPETFEWVRQFMDDELPYERFIAGRDAVR